MEEKIEHFRHELSHWITDFEEEYAKEMEDIFDQIISRYKELKEENLHWKGQYYLLSRKIDVIPKSKVKEKLKELDKEEKEAPITIQWEMEDMIEAKIQVLQELLEES